MAVEDAETKIQMFVRRFYDLHRCGVGDRAVFRLLVLLLTIIILDPPYQGLGPQDCQAACS